LRQRDTNVTADEQQPGQKLVQAVKEKGPSGKSLSSILQSRSEAALAEDSEEQLEVVEPQPQSPLPDIDSKDKHNPLAAAEYASDIFSYYKRIEPLFRPSPNYMKYQVRRDCIYIQFLVHYMLFHPAESCQILHAVSSIWHLSSL
jgi:hypothetical protein